MSENSATKTFRNNWASEGAHPQRIEDKITPGIPDTNICWLGLEAWFEGKFLRKLPARDDTLVQFGSKGEPRLRHQRNWLTTRAKAGGSAFWWVRVQDTCWFMCDHNFDWLKDGVRKDLFLAQHEYMFSDSKAMIKWAQGVMLDNQRRRVM